MNLDDDALIAKIMSLARQGVFAFIARSGDKSALQDHFQDAYLIAWNFVRKRRDQPDEDVLPLIPQRVLYDLTTKQSRTKKENGAGLLTETIGKDEEPPTQAELSEERHILLTVLTAFEREVFELRAQGYTFREIERELNLPPRSAGTIWRAIVAKIKGENNV